MKKIISIAFWMCVTGFAFANVSVAEESKAFTVDTSLGLYSDYTFRGFTLYEGTSIQPSITGNYNTDIGTFSANLWMHVSAESGSDDSKFTELDETLEYSREFEDFTVALGHVWYTYPDKDDPFSHTAEFFGVIALNETPLNPVLSVYHDYREFDTQYYELGFSHSFEDCFEGSSATVAPFVAFGFGSNTEKVYADDGLEQVTFGTAMNVPIGSLSLAPTINYTAKVDDNTVNKFWFGTALNYSF